MKYIISGGGTGGHIFPAISIANEIKKRDKEADILFVGALGRMEMERVPQAGYSIKGLPVKGFDRKNLLKNIRVVVDLLKSIKEAKWIIKDFNPSIAIGVGGYASAPVLKSASKVGIPTLLQEQNSFAGVTNKLLAKKAAKICVAYEGMEKFFPKERIILTGNPVRQDLFEVAKKSEEAYRFFNFTSEKQTLLIVGGSLGALTINESVRLSLRALIESGVQVIWQTGKNYIHKAKEEIKKYESNRIVVTDFVSRMDFAYSVADLVISRAGASSISELSLLSKSVILVPSPNVAEDHQTHNAMALVNRNAALMIRDVDAREKLISSALDLLKDEKKLKELGHNIEKMALKNASEKIVDAVFDIIQLNEKK